MKTVRVRAAAVPVGKIYLLFTFLLFYWCCSDSKLLFSEENKRRLVTGEDNAISRSSFGSFRTFFKNIYIYIFFLRLLCVWPLQKTSSGSSFFKKRVEWSLFWSLFWSTIANIRTGWRSLSVALYFGKHKNGKESTIDASCLGRPTTGASQPVWALFPPSSSSSQDEWLFVVKL